MKRYRTIVADPPWHYDKQGTGASYSRTGRRTAGLPYGTMTLDEIAALNVRAVAENGAHLYLWTTNKYLESSFQIARAWGFTHTATLVWCKQHGLGSGGAFYSNVEFVLYCKNTEGSPAPTPARVRTRWFTWPRSHHSAKPEAFLDIVEQVSPGPYLELFARRQRLGWDTWGNEARCDVDLEAIS